jgi:hypothetical protein
MPSSRFPKTSATGVRVPLRRKANAPTAGHVTNPTEELVRREIRWAWRNITARRWRAALTIGVLALALAATTIVFSAADSLVVRRVAYPAPDRLITFDTRDARTGRPGGGFASAAVLDEWRKQTDLFSGVHGQLHKTIFLAGRR